MYQLITMKFENECQINKNCTVRFRDDSLKHEI